jgi:hypothetical protein
MEIYYIISFLLSLIILVAFFKMGINLRAVRDELADLRSDRKKDPRLEHNLSYQTARVLGDKQEAIKHLTYILIYDLTAEHMSSAELRTKYEEFKTKNTAKFEELGANFPEFPF